MQVGQYELAQNIYDVLHHIAPDHTYTKRLKNSYTQTSFSDFFVTSKIEAYSVRLIFGHAYSIDFPHSDAVKRIFKEYSSLIRAKYSSS